MHNVHKQKHHTAKSYFSNPLSQASFPVVDASPVYKLESWMSVCMCYMAVCTVFSLSTRYPCLKCGPSTDSHCCTDNSATLFPRQKHFLVKVIITIHYISSLLQIKAPGKWQKAVSTLLFLKQDNYKWKHKTQIE